MIHDIGVRLVGWCEWRLTRYSYSYRTVLGDIHEQRVIVRNGKGAHPGPARTRAMPAPNREILDLDRAISELDPGAQRVVLLYYAGCCTLAALDQQATNPAIAAMHRAVSKADVADALAIRRQGVTERLHTAHGKLELLMRSRRSARRPLKPRAQKRTAHLDAPPGTRTQSRPMR